MPGLGRQSSTKGWSCAPTIIQPDLHSIFEHFLTSVHFRYHHGRMGGDKELDAYGDTYAADSNVRDIQTGEILDNADHLQRRLANRQIQLIAIGGSIGTALFVSIGGGLNKGGPGSLFLAYLLYSCLLGLVNNSMAEMGTLMPVSGGFVRMAGKWVDDAFGFMAGWNFFFYEALLIPFEITALNVVLEFWSDNIPTAAICAACIVLYA